MNCLNKSPLPELKSFLYFSRPLEIFTSVSTPNELVWNLIDSTEVLESIWRKELVLIKIKDSDADQYCSNAHLLYIEYKAKFMGVGMLVSTILILYITHVI